MRNRGKEEFVHVPCAPEVGAAKLYRRVCGESAASVDLPLTATWLGRPDLRLLIGQLNLHRCFFNAVAAHVDLFENVFFESPPSRIPGPISDRPGSAYLVRTID